MKRLPIVSFFILFMLSAFSQDTIVIQPGTADGKDAKVKSMSPDQNLGYSTDITAHAFDLGSDTNYTRSFIEFDLSALPPSSIIFEAKLSLFIASDLPNYPPGQSGENEWCIRRVTETWGEDQVTWNNQPSSTTLDEVNLPKSTNNLQNYPDIDVTDIIEFLVHNPDSNFGIMFKLYEEIAHKTICFASSDYSNSDLRPKLEIVYFPPILPSPLYSFYRLGDSIIFTNESVDADTYYWDFGDGFSSTLENPIHHYTSYDKYNVCLTGFNVNGESTYCDSINVCPLVKAKFQYLIQGDTVIFINLSSNALTYYWDFGDGYGTILENPFHYYGSHGTYDVCLTVNNECSVDTLCESIELTSIKEEKISLDNILVYPNPASIIIYIKNRSNISMKLRIGLHDMMGKNLLDRDIYFGIDVLQEIDLSGFKPGIYLLNLSDGIKSKSRKIQIIK